MVDKHGSDVNAYSTHGKTALMSLVERTHEKGEYEEIKSLLLAAGADPKMPRRRERFKLNPDTGKREMYYEYEETVLRL